MGLHKKYSGYKTFDYLEKGVDYEEFKLAKEVDRVPPYLVSLSASEGERVNRIVNENIVISIHDHPLVYPEDMTETPRYGIETRRSIAYEGLSKSCLDCVFDNLGGSSRRTSKCGWKWDDIIQELGIRLSDIAHQDFVLVAKRVDDILRAHKEGKVAFVFAIEGAMPIENEVDRIDVLYGLGLRVMGLSYSESSALATGAKENRDGGLTYFGHQCVDRMNKLGMAIDVSHCSDQATLDAVEVSKKPVFATHMGARALWNIKKLKPDNVLKAIADKGGVIGIESAPHSTLTKRHPVHCIEATMEHFEYIKNLVGIDHVGFGPDTLYGDHVGYHHVFSAALAMKEAHGVTSETLETELPYVKGLENPTEASWNSVRWLVKRGYSDRDVAKAIGENAIRVLKEAWV